MTAPHRPPSPSLTRVQRAGLLYAVLTAPWMYGLVVLMVNTPAVMAKALTTSTPSVIAAAAYGLAVCVGGLYLARGLAGGVDRETPGRLRLKLLGYGTAVSVLFTAAVLVMIAAGAGADDDALGDFLGVQSIFPWLSRAAATPNTALFQSPPWVQQSLVAVVVFDFVARIPAALALWSLWFLVSARTRHVIWRVVDGLLLIGVVAAVAFLPASPNGSDRHSLTLAITRLVVETVFAARLFIRALPLVLPLIEGINFRSFIAVRHLQSRNSKSVTVIGALAVVAVAMSTAALAIVLSVMGGFRSDLQRKILGNSAHIVVDHGEDGVMEPWSLGLAAVRSTDGVRGATPFVTGEVMVSSATNLAGAILKGIDPASVGQVSDIVKNTKSGGLKYLVHPEGLLAFAAGVGNTIDPLSSTGNSKDDLDRLLHEANTNTNKPTEVLPGVLVGQELARTLRLYVGDEVNLVSPLGGLGPTGPVPKSRPFRVAGIFYSGMYEYDMKRIYVAMDVGQRFLGLGNGIHGIDIKVGNVDDAPDIAKSLQTKLGPDLRVQDWQSLNKNLFGALALEKIAMFIALGLAILVAGFCVFGTLTLFVQQKGREVGVIQSMGATPPDILRIFLTEGFLVGLFGTTIGLGIGYLACFAAKHIGVGMNSEIYYMSTLPVHMDPLEFAAVGVVSVSACVVATIVPSFIASRIRPVEAIKFA